MVKQLKEIYDEAKSFVNENFPNLSENNYRITLLAIIKNLIEIQGQELEERKLISKASQPI